MRLSVVSFHHFVAFTSLFGHFASLSSRLWLFCIFVCLFHLSVVTLRLTVVVSRLLVVSLCLLKLRGP